MNNIEKRLAALEERKLNAGFLAVEQMTDEELEAFLAADPKSGAVLGKLTNEQLEAIIRGEPAATALYHERLDAL